MSALLQLKGHPGKQCTICDFVPERSFPLNDKEGSSLAFSCLKKSSMFDSGLACSDTNIWVMIEVEVLFELGFLDFSRFAGGM